MNSLDMGAISLLPCTLVVILTCPQTLTGPLPPVKDTLWGALIPLGIFKPPESEGLAIFLIYVHLMKKPLNVCTYSHWVASVAHQHPY